MIMPWALGLLSASNAHDSERGNVRWFGPTRPQKSTFTLPHAHSESDPSFVGIVMTSIGTFQLVRVRAMGIEAVVAALTDHDLTTDRFLTLACRMVFSGGASLVSAHRQCGCRRSHREAL